MDSFSNTAKRKKRKTRKCLDEIRKRSRRVGETLFEKDFGKVGNVLSSYSTVNNGLVTNNRLTLRMFPKAVRSETITRPALIDLQDKSNLNLDELVKGTKAISTLSSASVRTPEFIDNFDNSSENNKDKHFKLFKKCTLEDSNHYMESDAKNMHTQEEKLSNNLDIFTSLDSAEVINKSPNSIVSFQSVSTITTSSDQSLHDDFGYNLYEEFMSEIPTFLKQNATFIQEDVMKKTKMFLQNLFIRSCYQECEKKLLKCKKRNTANKKKYTPSEMIVYNPMDYIRAGHLQQQSLFYRPSGISVIDGGCSIPHSPLMAASSPAASLESPLSVIVNDTPDYDYYPHRLN